MRMLSSNIKSLTQRLSGASVVSSWQVQKRYLTDIEYYKCVEYSHLHIWEAQSGILFREPEVVVSTCRPLPHELTLVLRLNQLFPIIEYFMGC